MTSTPETFRDILDEGYVLHWYEIKSVLGRGAFGVTYLALDKNLNQLVAIKEYFPRQFSTRDTGNTVHPTTGENQELYAWGLNRFLREAQTLAKFKHHNIVRVMSVFELNNTAYMIMEYEQGEELSKIYKRKQHFSEKELLDIFLPIMDGLKLVHNASFIHRDIKPSNIYIRNDGSPVLIDFGAARMATGSATRTLTSLVTYGYAPFEQYNETDEKQGPWTDIYALGACLHYAVTGKLPLDAMVRGSSLLSSGVDPYEPISKVEQDKYSDTFLRAIDHALMFHTHERPQTIHDWMDMLQGKVEVPPLREELFTDTTIIYPEHDTQIQTQPLSGVPPRGANQPPAEPKPVDTERIEAVVAEPVRPNRWLGKLSILAITLLLVIGGILFFTNQKPEAPVSAERESVAQHASGVVASLLERADKAKAEGNFLDAENGAIHIYREVLNIDPGNKIAAAGIRDVVSLYSERIRSDLAAGLFDKVQQQARFLQAAAPNSSIVSKLVDEIRLAKARQDELDQLLKQAEADMEAGRYIRPENRNALEKYRRVLQHSRDNPKATKGVATILAQLLSLAESHMKNGDLASAEQYANDALTVDADSEEVEKLRGQVQALRGKKATISQLIADAKREFEAGNITEPAGSNALALYGRALKLDANNKTALRGVSNVAAYLKAQFANYLDREDYTSAEAVVIKTERLMPKSKLAKTIRAQLEQKKPPPRPDMDIISELLGKFKKHFETRNVAALRELSEFQPNRQSFLKQFFENYKSFSLAIADVRYIGSDRKGTAEIILTNLVNINGVEVKPGNWSRIKINVQRNAKGRWKIFW